MAKKIIQDDFDDTNEVDVDTHEVKFQCKNPEPHLNFDLGIDV